MNRTGFVSNLQQISSMTHDKDLIIMAGRFDEHVWQHSNGYLDVHGYHDLGSRNKEETKVLECCDVNDMLMCNNNLRKPTSHLITW